MPSLGSQGREGGGGRGREHCRCVGPSLCHECLSAPLCGARTTACPRPSFDTTAPRDLVSFQKFPLATAPAHLGLALHQHDVGDDGSLEAPRGLQELSCAQRPRGSGQALQRGTRWDKGTHLTGRGQAQPRRDPKSPPAAEGRVAGSGAEGLFLVAQKLSQVSAALQPELSKESRQPPEGAV